MPLVPQARGPSVSHQVSPTVRTAPGPNPLESVAPALAETSRAVATIEQDELQKVRRAMLTGAQTALIGAETDVLWNKDTGAYSQRGKNAFDLNKRFQPQFKEQADKIREGITDERVKAAYDEFAADRTTDMTRGMERHEFGERETYYAGEAKGGIAAASEMAARLHNDPVQSNKFLAQVEQLTREEGQRVGASQDEIDSAVLIAGSSTRRAVATQFVDAGLYDQAKAYMDSNKGSLLSKDEDAIEDMIRVGKEHDEARKRQMIAQARVDEAYFRDRRYEDAAKMVEQGIAVPNSLYWSLDANQRAALRKDESGEKVVTNWTEFNTAMLLSRTDPDKFLKDGLSSLLPLMADAEKKSLISRRDSLLKDRNAEMDDATTTLLTSSTEARAMLKGLLYPGEKLDKDEQTLVDGLMTQLNADIQRESAVKGGKLTPAETSTIIADFAGEAWRKKNPNVRQPDWIFDNSIDTTAVDITEVEDAYIKTGNLPPIENIPAIHKNALQEYAATYGYLLTDEEMREAWGTYQLLGTERAEDWIKAHAR